MRVLSGHDGAVLCVAYSPDGRLLASGGADRIVRIWDVAAGRVQETLSVGEPVLSLAYAPDGATLAVGTYGGVVLWDLRQRQPDPPVLHGDRPGTYRVVFTPDGQTVVLTGYLESHLHFHDLRRWVTSQPAHTPLKGVLAMAHAADAPWLVTGGGLAYGELMLWDSEKRDMCVEIAEPFRLAVPSREEYLRWGEIVPRDTWAAHRQPVYAVAFSPDGRLIASGSKDRTAKVWNWETIRRLITLEGHGGTVVAVSFTPDGRTLLTADETGIIRMWDVAAGRLRSSFDWRIGRLRSVVFSPDGMTATAGGSDGSVLVWDVEY